MKFRFIEIASLMLAALPAVALMAADIPSGQASAAVGQGAGPAPTQIAAHAPRDTQTGAG